MQAVRRIARVAEIRTVLVLFCKAGLQSNRCCLGRITPGIHRTVVWSEKKVADEEQGTIMAMHVGACE